jgi:hypothetical protein
VTPSTEPAVFRVTTSQNVAAGEDLTEHLSRVPIFALEPAKKRKQIPGKRRDRDAARLGIDHLHST